MAPAHARPPLCTSGGPGWANRGEPQLAVDGVHPRDSAIFMPRGPALVWAKRTRHSIFGH